LEEDALLTLMFTTLAVVVPHALLLLAASLELQAYAPM
jgi:hypothetical protein